MGDDTRLFEIRFWSKVECRGLGECWPWMGSKNRGGYGEFKLGGKVVRAHRVAYEFTIGPIPAGMHLDHVRARGCVRRDCVNPDHLEAVTKRENTVRGDGNGNREKTHCPEGHPYDEVNTYIYNGWRHCRSCRRGRNRTRAQLVLALVGR